ncbi:MAG: DUF4864 domain-containing protein [Pseudomonadota bacterium]
MKKLLLAVGLFLGTLVPAWANETDIQSTIQRQIDAFKADDFSTAFSFASPMIQGMFRSPDRFGQMVQQGFPMVHRPADVQFQGLRDDQGLLIQRVLIRDTNGLFHTLDYQMIEQDTGWKINGVTFVQAPSVGA